MSLKKLAENPAAVVPDPRLLQSLFPLLLNSCKADKTYLTSCKRSWWTFTPTMAPPSASLARTRGIFCTFSLQLSLHWVNCEGYMKPCQRMAMDGKGVTILVAHYDLVPGALLGLNGCTQHSPSAQNGASKDMLLLPSSGTLGRCSVQPTPPSQPTKLTHLGMPPFLEPPMPISFLVWPTWTQHMFHAKSEALTLTQQLPAQMLQSSERSRPGEE